VGFFLFWSGHNCLRVHKWENQHTGDIFVTVCVICFQILLEVWQQKTRNGQFRLPCLSLRASSWFGASTVFIGTCALVYFWLTYTVCHMCLLLACRFKEGTYQLLVPDVNRANVSYWQKYVYNYTLGSGPVYVGWASQGKCLLHVPDCLDTWRYRRWNRNM